MIKQKVKILHIVGHLGRGGDTTAIMNVLDYINENNCPYIFDFITHKGCDETFIKKLRESGSKVYVLDGDVHKVGTIKYFINIKQILNNNDYDCVHFHTSFQSCVGLFAAKVSKVKTRICHSHTTSVQHNCNKLKKFLYLPFCRLFIKIFATDYVACSNEAFNYLFLKSCEKKIIYNGLDFNKLNLIDLTKINEIKKKINYKKGYKIIGEVGRLTDMKNPDFTLDLAKKLENDKFIFVLLGTGNQEKQMKMKAKKLNLKNVYFMGQVKDVNNYMKIFDYLLLPSKYGEGLPVVLIEEQIINNNCLCIANDIVSKEANLGNVLYISIKNQNEWLNIIKNHDYKLNKIDGKNFNINTTALKWLDLYK